MTEQKPARGLLTPVFEEQSWLILESRRRQDDSINPTTPYAGQAFAWHTMTAAERQALIQRCQEGQPGRRKKYARRDYYHE